MTTAPAPTPSPAPISAAPIAISKIDVDKLVAATKLVAPFIPKSWMRSTIIITQIVSIVTALAGAFVAVMPADVAMTIMSVLALITIVLRVVNPNPPIKGSPQDLTSPPDSTSPIPERVVRE